MKTIQTSNWESRRLSECFLSFFLSTHPSRQPFITEDRPSRKPR
jgi:hypothetical protein